MVRRDQVVIQEADTLRAACNIEDAVKGEERVARGNLDGDC